MIKVEDIENNTDAYLDVYNTRATHVSEVINKHYLHTYAHATIKHAKAMRSILYKGLRTFMIYEYEGVLSVLFFMLKCKCQVVMQELGKCMYICIYRSMYF